MNKSDMICLINSYSSGFSNLRSLADLNDFIYPDNSCVLILSIRPVLHVYLVIYEYVYHQANSIGPV